MKWFEIDNANANGVVVSSRVRLARNLVNYCFPNRISHESANHLIQDIRSFFTTLCKEDENMCLEEIELSSMSDVNKMAMMERYLVSPNFLNNQQPRTLFLSKDESISIMVNEEDHLRMQAFQTGIGLEKAFNKINMIDDKIENKLSYAFNRQLGYLTACPTNVGTGMRASYMLHLPALETTGHLRLFLDAIGKFGMTVRGIYGEGSESQGSVYQISNQVTLGLTEEEILENLTSVTKQIVEQELILRGRMLSEKRLILEDAIYRSYGLLSNARIMPAKEAMTLLSDIKLGFELGIIKTNDEKAFNVFRLMTCIQPANLYKNCLDEVTAENRDRLRATYIREHLPTLI